MIRAAGEDATSARAGALADLDDLVAAAARRLGVTVVRVTLRQDDRSWHSAPVGLSELDIFADALLAQGGVTVIRDAREAARAGRGPGELRAFAGKALLDTAGETLGALVAADRVARDFSGEDREVLSELAGRIAARIEAEHLATQLTRSEDHFRHAIELNPQLLWTASGSGEVDSGNRRWRMLVGLSVGEPIGNGWAEAVHPDDIAGTFAVWAACLRSGEHLDHEYRLRLANGLYRWHRARAVPRLDADGRIFRWYGSLEDVHDAKLGLLALQESERRLRYALEVGRLGAWDLDLQTRVLTASDICAACFGWERGEQIRDYERVLLSAIHPGDREHYRAAFEASLAENRELTVEYRTIWPDGTTHWVRLTGRPLHDEHNRPARMIGLAHDITEQRRKEEARRQAEEQTAFLARHDALTGVANRRLFNERLEQALAATGTGAQVALLSIDLDRFKAINDTMGHGAGDALLCFAAERLQNCLGPGDLLARYGGDEFAVLHAGFAAPSDVRALAVRILEVLAAPFDLDGETVQIGGSIGISLAPRDTQKSAELWRNADLALYCSKRQGRGIHHFYDAALDGRSPDRPLNLALRHALDREEFGLVFQPVIELASGRCVCLEAFLRWQSPEHGEVLAVEFIPLAEKTGWIVPIGRWALHEACRAAALWPDDVRVAVNLSAVQFGAGGLEAEVADALAASGLPPSRLELEITETLLLHEGTSSLEVLDALRVIGARIVLDDFGTGYSSLSRLRRFHFDAIKIDESLISSPPSSRIKDNTVRAIAGLGRSLGTETVAEGVETAEQLAQVRAHGCTHAQGHFVCSPLPAAEIAAWLARH